MQSLTSRRSRCFHHLVAICAVASAIPVAQAQGHLPDSSAYDLIDIGTLAGRRSQAGGINSSGQVAGFSMNGSGLAQALLYTPGRGTQYMPFPPTIRPNYGAITYGLDINDRGVLVGDWDISRGGGCYEAFISTGISIPTPLKDLASPIAGLPCTDGIAINNRNEFAGDAYSGLIRHAYVYRAGQAIDLHPASLGNLSYARSLNDHGNVVGMYVPFGATPTLWTGIRASISQGAATMRDLNHDVTGPFGCPSEGGAQCPTPFTFYELRNARGINAHNQIVGMAGSDLLSIIRAYLLTGRPGNYTFHDLGTLLNGGISYAVAVNNAAAVVGSAYQDATGAGNNVAALFTHGRVIDLNQTVGLLDRISWRLIEADGVNDNGEIVGYGTVNSEIHGFKLVPRSRLQARGVGVPFTLSAIVNVTGTVFRSNGPVEVEVHRGDIGGALLSRVVATTDSRGAFSLWAAPPCGQPLAISAWDRTSGVYSNSVNLRVACQ
jgi:uncharacterized membrane protein